MKEMMPTFAEVQTESNRLLIESPMALHTAGFVSPSSAASMTFTGNFSKRTSRFKGDRNDPTIVEAFVDAKEIYKECTNKNDIHALEGLSMLLEGEAAAICNCPFARHVQHAARHIRYCMKYSM